MTEDNKAPEALHHIGIVVPAPRYDDLVRGLSRSFDGDVVDSGEDEALDIVWAWLPGPGGVLMEAVAPRSNATTAITRFLDRTGGGLHHVSFETDRLDTCAELLAGRGASTIGHHPDHGGWAEFFLAPSAVGGARLHWMQRVSSA
ncbi:VOC family protein [Aeromicrobium sp. CTD01-1L150]|uniref:VOC family protein n=1 Tax=Aeromicrobium sp. CTD01-1L150 TaxID=3341830 RepID=UPI0035BF70A8